MHHPETAYRTLYHRPLTNPQIDYFNKRRTLELRQKATLEAAEKQRNENPNNAGR